MLDLKSLFLAGKWSIATKLAHDGLQVRDCIQGVLKVKVKGHVIRALLCWHENCFFSQGNGRTATNLAHDGLQVSRHPGCAQGQGQRSRDTGAGTKIAFSRTQTVDCDQTCTRWSTGAPASRVCSRSRSKVKGHVIWALLCWT